MRLNLGFVLTILLISNSLWSQSDSAMQETIKNNPEMFKGVDTILKRKLPEVDIKEYKTVKRTPEEEEAYQKLKRKVIKLYPYALLAKQIHETSKENMESLSTKREKRQFRKTKEKELRDRFEDELKALYRSDGPVLVKLIHRETGNTTYELLRESKSWIKCMVYQMAAKRNGYSLKATYDKENDKDIENIVEILKAEGQLPVYVPM